MNALRTKVEGLGYNWYSDSSRPFNLNIVGVRHGYSRVDKFNDELIVAWHELGRVYERRWPVTTLPGKPWLLSPITSKGCAILVPGQYIKAYALGYFRGYLALRQVSPVAVYRDNNKDMHIDIDFDTIEAGMFGIHIHKAGLFSSLIGIGSAGCQVFQKSSDFEQFILLCKEAAKYWGNSFTYTLLED